MIWLLMCLAWVVVGLIVAVAFGRVAGGGDW